MHGHQGEGAHDPGRTGELNDRWPAARRSVQAASYLSEITCQVSGVTSVPDSGHVAAEPVPLKSEADLQRRASTPDPAARPEPRRPNS